VGRNLSLGKDYELLPKLRGVRVRGSGRRIPQGGVKAGFEDVLCLGTNFSFLRMNPGARGEKSLGNALRGAGETALFPNLTCNGS